MLLLVVGSMTACAGSNRIQNSYTPIGTNQIQVVATSTTAGTSVSHTTAPTLTVQLGAMRPSCPLRRRVPVRERQSKIRGLSLSKKSAWVHLSHVSGARPLKAWSLTMGGCANPCKPLNSEHLLTWQAQWSRRQPLDCV